MTAPITFDYSSAFSRNIGWVTQAEQLKLKKPALPLPGWAVWVARIC